MNSTTGLRFLRPRLHSNLSAARRAAYLRFFSISTSTLKQNEKVPDRTIKTLNKYKHPLAADVPFRGEVQERIKELEVGNSLAWPRIKRDKAAIRVEDFLHKYKDLQLNELRENEFVLVRGRLRGFRVAGSSLVFLDLLQDGRTVQIVLNRARLESFGGVHKLRFKEFYHLIRRGDIMSVYGNPYSSPKGELSVNAAELPELLSPSLASLPRGLEDRETRIRNRHVDLLVNKNVADTIRVRSHIIQYLRNFLLKDNFLEVQTPIISDKAGGAIAKPFTTVATEFSEKTLALRIAPEIWLKRLIIGDMDRVFEIGPAFRNEGLDATHNPEFTTCEFYKAFADLEDLISMTESLFEGIAKMVTELRHHPLKMLPEVDMDQFTAPFKRIEFVPAVEAGLGQKLPDLSAEDAEEQLISLFKEKQLPLPSSTTLPRLLDKLSSIYIEPDCITPTFILYHPSCMAPLAKSFLCPTTKQLVSARAELFVDKRELANMYEEENSPFAQREKFLQQAKWRDDENRAVVDESYLEALVWGLPPTGGWGCGVDRLVMAFSGAKRISDVLAFGSLRNVVNLGREGAIPAEPESPTTKAEKKTDV
ncbi:lysyl-tRNA synthetase [Hyaloscypha variabilis]